jgi:hypothetical protein
LAITLAKNGIRLGAIKTESIRNWRAPTDVKQVRQFLGLCSFFRRTIESFAQTSGPLTKLTRKVCAWKGGPLPEDAQKAFEQLQSKLSSRPCLTPVDFDREFILTVDSSSIGVRAILSQFNNKGNEHPCTYASRVLTQAEASYSPCHLKASGLQWSTRHFRPYLIGRHFTTRTDHKPLVSMNKTHSLALDRIYAELRIFMKLLVKGWGHPFLGQEERTPELCPLYLSKSRLLLVFVFGKIVVLP